MKQYFYAPAFKSEKKPIVGRRVKVAFENKRIPHFAYLGEGMVIDTTDRSFKFAIDIAGELSWATATGEGMDLSSGILIESEATEGSRCVFEVPNDYAWAVE